VARNPGDASVKIEYARALDEADRPEEALAVLREAEKQMVYGQHETVQVMLGAALSRLGRFPEAADALHRALDIEPDNAGTARDLGYCLFRAGRFTEAVPYYMRAEAALPDDPVIPAELALCQASLKDYGAAAQSFERAIRLQPSQETYFNYAFMTAEAGDLAKATGLMALSLEQTPRNPRLAARGSALLEEWKGRSRR
jgi:Flp pilus assembly protein TadD